MDRNRYKNLDHLVVLNSFCKYLQTSNTEAAAMAFDRLQIDHPIAKNLCLKKKLLEKYNLSYLEVQYNSNYIILYSVENCLVFLKSTQNIFFVRLIKNKNSKRVSKTCFFLKSMQKL